MGKGMTLDGATAVATVFLQGTGGGSPTVILLIKF
jgi:hypothetical protein